MIQEGDRFPDFSLPDQDGRIVSLESLAGERAVIYFYPKDDTSGCTAEACDFRDSLPDFGTVKVYGVSPDSDKSHRKFIEKYSLSFPLLSDANHELAEACGVWVEKSMYGKKYMGIERTTYLIDANGKILKIWRKVKVPDHVSEVKDALSI